MSVYVDRANIPYRGQRYCHMRADSHEELMAMARRIGLKPQWLQKPGTPREHFDVGPRLRALAVASGAIEVTTRELVRGMLCREGSEPRRVIDKTDQV